MDLATLRKLEPAEFEDAADAYRATGDTASTAKDHIDNVVLAGMRKSLKGEALDAAVAELKRLSSNFHYVRIECGLVSTALNAFAFELAAARRSLLAALAEASAARLTVNADGTVTYPEGSPKDGSASPVKGGTVGSHNDPTAQAIARQAANADPNPHHAAALDVADRIAHALREATATDVKWAPKILALKADDDLTVSREDMRDAQSDMGGVREAGKEYLATIGGPPNDATPQQNADWWNALSAEEREAYLATRPDLVGRLDGLPAEIRDEANRVVFEEKRAEYQFRLNSIPQPPLNEWTYITAGGYPSKVHTDEWMEWNRKYGTEYSRLTRSLKGMDAIQNRFDDTGKEGLPEAYLLGFSPEGNGRAIVATGNPDTAHHQAVFVPGTGSNLEKAGGDIDRMNELWRQTNMTTPGSAVSTITWIGYDAPQDVFKDAPFEHYAYDGAPAYRDFLDGLDASHSGPAEPHRTAIGHSYGTTLIGAAAETGTLSADDVILAGSPGVKVGHADDLDVPHGHVWNEEADDDPVPDIGRWGHGGSHWADGGGVFLIPSDEAAFGANQMNTEAEGSGPTGTSKATGHSEYWNRGTTALKNQALVVVGEYQYVTTPE